jgi:hypothetical protein
MFTRELLHALFIYDNEQGLLKWKIRTNYNRKLSNEGKVAGYLSGLNRLKIDLFGKSHFHSRLVFIYHYGEINGVIDHIDGNTLNDKIENLRDVSKRINQMNRKTHRGGRLVGASYVKKINKWASHISINKKQIYLGRFDTELEAHIAYVNCLNDYEKEHILPLGIENPHNSADLTKSHISYDKQKQRWVFEISNQGKRIKKRFKTKEEAILFKEEYIKQLV